MTFSQLKQEYDLKTEHDNIQIDCGKLMEAKIQNFPKS